MRPWRWSSVVALTSVVTGCAGEAPPDAPAGPQLAVDVAALNLVGVGDAVWDLEVDNAAGQVVWQKRVSSSGYGDGAGSASYVGTCDADSNPNTVKVWVVGVYDDAVSALGSFASGGVNGAVGPDVPFQNPTASAPLTQTVTCEANADVAVQFDVALMRPAQQGFFDIAVNFNNIFCSAKLDCCADTGDGVCQASEDLKLLFDADGARARTLVLGFACTAGTDSAVDTALYMDPLGFNCGVAAAGTPDFTVSPAAANTGNQCTAGDVSACPIVDELDGVSADTYLYQVAVYRGDEPLQSAGADAHKAYWNVALGVTASIGDCTLLARATADNVDDDLDGMAGGVVTAGAVYPYVRWNVPLATCAEEQLSFDGTGTVQTAYTATGDGATAFGYAYASSLPVPVCALPCLNGGSCTAPNTCTCPVGYGGPQCESITAFASCQAAYLAGQTASGVYQLDPGNTGTPFDAYCNMADGGGWTLVGKFSNQDAKHWIDAKTSWTGTATFGDATTLTAGVDAKSPAWSRVVASDFLFSDTFDVGKTMQTTGSCIGGQTLSAFFTTVLANYPDTSSSNYAKKCSITKTYTYAPHWMAEPGWNGNDVTSTNLGPNQGHILFAFTDLTDTAAVISGYAEGMNEADVGLAPNEGINNDTTNCADGFCDMVSSDGNAYGQDLGGPTSCGYSDATCRTDYPETVYLWVR